MERIARGLGNQGEASTRITVTDMAMIFGEPKMLEALAFFKIEARNREDQNEALMDLIVVTEHESKKSKKSRPQPMNEPERDFAEL